MKNSVFFRLAALLLALLFCFLTGCVRQQADPSGSEVIETADTGADAEETSAEEKQKDQIPFGTPFCMTLEAGNLPADKGSPAQDLNVYYNFDFFLEQKEGKTNSYYARLGKDEFKETVISLIKDESLTFPGLEQLRLFYRQAQDLEASDERGLSDLQPYLDRIDAAADITAFGEVLSSPDFPFSPFLTSVVSPYDMSKETVFALYPNYLIYDFMDGAETMQDTETEDDVMAKGILELSRMADSIMFGEILTVLGVDEQEIDALRAELLDFEKQYGKYAFYSNQVLKAEYGELGSLYNLLSLGELAGRLENFPIRGILSKDGRDCSPYFTVMDVEWLEHLDMLWTDENLDTLKMIAKSKVLLECAPYLTSEIAQVKAMADVLMSDTAAEVKDPNDIRIDLDERAYAACDSLDTFDELLANLYTEQHIGAQGKARIADLAERLRMAYLRIFEKTSWLDEDSKQALIRKLEGMNFEILGPESGYIGFDDVRLIPSEEGGTLIGNYLLLKKHRIEHENAMIGKPADPGFLFHTLKASTVNCFYSAEGNCINILPAFLSSQFYQDSYTEEELLGGIGYVIAHEISHAFDNIGSQYDENGLLNCCFTAGTLDTYLELCGRIRNYYDQIYVIDGRYVSGERVLAEACADLSGMGAIIESASTVENFDYDRFFQRIALVYRDVAVPGTAALMLLVDTHPLGYLRINVNVQMYDKFYEFFGVKEGDGMYVAPENRLYLFGK